MVDEAHERSLATDVLLGLLKKVQRQRPDLRVVISSATLQADKIAAFFDTATVKGRADKGVSCSPAIMSVEGRTHPVQVRKGSLLTTKLLVELIVVLHFTLHLTLCMKVAVVAHLTASDCPVSELQCPTP